MLYFAIQPKIVALSASLLATLAFAGCNKNNAQTSASGQKAQTAKPAIEFRRTPCFGTCPIYRATVTEAGVVTFTGERFTEKTGTYKATIPAAEVSQLLTEASEINFYSLDTLYVTGATDFPSQILTLRDKGKTHTIRTEGEGPKEVELLMQKVDQAIMHAVRTNGEAVKP